MKNALWVPLKFSATLMLVAAIIFSLTFVDDLLVRIQFAVSQATFAVGAITYLIAYYFLYK